MNLYAEIPGTNIMEVSRSNGVPIIVGHIVFDPLMDHYSFYPIEFLAGSLITSAPTLEALKVRIETL